MRCVVIKKSFQKTVRWRKENVEGFQSLHFYWSFSSDTMVMKGLIRFDKTNIQNSSRELLCVRFDLCTPPYSLRFFKVLKVDVRQELTFEDVLLMNLCTLYLHACQVRVTVGDSGLCCTCLTYFES